MLFRSVRAIEFLVDNDALSESVNVGPVRTRIPSGLRYARTEQFGFFDSLALFNGFCRKELAVAVVFYIRISRVFIPTGIQRRIFCGEYRKIVTFGAVGVDVPAAERIPSGNGIV